MRGIVRSVISPVFIRKSPIRGETGSSSCPCVLCVNMIRFAIETLNLAGMKRLWGRKISDLAFGEFSLILQWTCAKYGKTFLAAGRWTATTKPCFECGTPNENLTLSERQWTCPECGFHHDRDINAAINILQAGVPA